MIGFLRGRVLEKEKDRVIIDVGGIGFEVRVPWRLIDEKIVEGEPVSLYIHTHFFTQDNRIELFGFLTAEERNIFRILVNTPSVGTKLALSILSSFSFPELVGIILSGDVDALTRAKGVGRKLAELLIVELKDKVRELGVTDFGNFSLLNDVVGALRSLDIPEGEARKLAKRAMEIVGEDATLEEIITRALSLVREK